MSYANIDGWRLNCKAVAIVFFVSSALRVRTGLEHNLLCGSEPGFSDGTRNSEANLSDAIASIASFRKLRRKTKDLSQYTHVTLNTVAFFKIVDEIQLRRFILNSSGYRE